MPGGNRMGPRGMGPMTGRGMGYCAGYAAPVRGGFGMGGGYWRRGGYPGGGRGWRNWYHATGLTGVQRAAGWQGQAYASGPTPGFYGPAVTPEQQLEALKNQAEYMEGTLADLKRQIETLEAQGQKESK